MTNAIDAVKRKPAVKKGNAPETLPYGGATQVNGAAAGLDQASPAPYAESINPQEAQPLQGDLTGFDNVLFGRTDRPDEPITTGAPFGEGSNFLTGSAPSAEEQLKMMAEKIANEPNSTPRTRAFLARVIRGE